jgi:LETM1 and EF-hand domain-containing protein 1
MIATEGVESLNYFELREALAYRGMRSVGLSQPAYMEELKSWLDLHLNKNVPTTLLLMSRAFKITQKDRSEEGAIKETLQAMSKEATNRHAFSKV